VIGEGISQTYSIPTPNSAGVRYWQVYTVEFQGGAVKSNSFKAINTLTDTEPTECNW